MEVGLVNGSSEQKAICATLALASEKSVKINYKAFSLV